LRKAAAKRAQTSPRTNFGGVFGGWGRGAASLALQDHRRAVTEQALVDGEADACTLDLAPLGLAPQLPGELADLGQGLGGHGLAEAGQPAAGVDGDTAADGGVAVVEQTLGLARLAEADVLVPVELEGGGEVVDLGHVEVVGTNAGLLVGLR